MIGLFSILQYMNPSVSIHNCDTGSPNGYEEILKWDASLGPQPTQSEIDAARSAAELSMKMSAIRAERDVRLAATDYLAMPDYPNKPVSLTTYRQALRDFPATINAAALSWPLDVNTLNWPIL